MQPARFRQEDILLYGKLCERARWTKSREMIGYPSGQDGAILPARDYPLYPARKTSPKAILTSLLVNNPYLLVEINNAKVHESNREFGGGARTPFPNSGW